MYGQVTMVELIEGVYLALACHATAVSQDRGFQPF